MRRRATRAGALRQVKNRRRLVRVILPCARGAQPFVHFVPVHLGAGKKQEANDT